MITTEDMALVLAEKLRSFGRQIYVKGHIPFAEEEITEGCITITPKDDSVGSIFDRCFVEVNFLEPDVYQEANAELDSLERQAYELFKDGFSDEYGGQWYRVSYSRRSRERDEKLKCHYAHFQLLFETLNTL